VRVCVEFLQEYFEHEFEREWAAPLP